MKKHRYFALLLVFTLTFALFTGCSGAASFDKSTNEISSSAGSPSYNDVTADEQGIDYDAGEGEKKDTNGTVRTDRLLIWTGNIALETYDFTTAYDALTALVEQYEGYIQSTSIFGGGTLSSADLTVRVPNERFADFMDSTGGVATMVNSSSNSEDVTETYYDLEARLDVLNVKEERLLAMLKKDGDLQYILQIETELANTRYEIESIAGSLRRYDSKITYSTVYIHLAEVTDISATPPSELKLGERIAVKFNQSLAKLKISGANLTVWLLGNSLQLIITALAIWAVVAIVRHRVRKLQIRKAGAGIADDRGAANLPGHPKAKEVPEKPQDHEE